MRIVIAPQYEPLRHWVENLPATFATQGEVIYDARNQIRVFSTEWGQINVKRFRQPSFCQRIAYTFFRQPKAQRAYNNALLLQNAGIPTPTPIAYILCGEGLLTTSYLVTLQVETREMFYLFGDGKTEEREDLLTAFAQLTAHMHNKGIMHLDFSPGNILYGKKDNQWLFNIVDINRMYFGKVSPRMGCRNFARLWGGHAFVEHIARIYAQERHLNTQYCLNEILKAHRHFWRYRHPEKFFRYES